ncbi:DNA-processing protein DprA [Anaerovorax sp. IOR16]|uniref:DNA-processing protein DprA n=1 Tax=Anaerovorax sp. IOR16 TaxID=2773458 RepID=UPI0019D1CA84|nr:DNA-processing protein DprA [Anaerovorax sp. IOR16]
MNDLNPFVASVYEIWFDRLQGIRLPEKIRLIKKYQDCAAIYACADIIGLSKNLDEAEEQIIYMKKHKIGSVSYLNDNYPFFLREMNNPPCMLYYKGKANLWNTPCVAIVGARKVSSYGKIVSLQLAERMAKCNVTVVSGLAYGVDTFAHKGVLENGGNTIAVLGCGVDLCYPSSNKTLMEEIEKKGLIVSEFLPGTPPRPFRFPLRNRIISGLSQAVIVTEAGLSSGSLITAEFAAEQGRDIFSVPGNITQRNSIGTNKLIQDGAIPVVTVLDVEKNLGFTAKKEEYICDQSLGMEEKQLYDAILIEGETTIDFLCKKLKRTPSYINGLVTILEIKGVIQTCFGKIFIAK